MASTLVPLTGKRIAALPIGASVVYRFVYSAIPGPDPSTWDTIRFSIADAPGGTAYFTVEKADMTVTPGGTSGAYTVTIDVPVSAANSALIDVGNSQRWYQLDFASSGGYQDILEDGLVAVYNPAPAFA